MALTRADRDLIQHLMQTLVDYNNALRAMEDADATATRLGWRTEARNLHHGMIGQLDVFLPDGDMIAINGGSAA